MKKFWRNSEPVSNCTLQHFPTMWDELPSHSWTLLLICWLIDTIVTIVIFNCHCIWLFFLKSLYLALSSSLFFWIKNLELVPCKVLPTQTQVKVRLLATNQRHLKKRGRKWEENEKEGVDRFIHNNCSWLVLVFTMTEADWMDMLSAYVTRN